MNNSCRISFEARLDVYEGRASAETCKLVNRHIAENCPACAVDLAWLADNLPALQFALQQDVQSVSDWALARALRIMPPKAETVVRRLVAAAHLLFDSRNRNTAFVPARAGADGSVHVVYRTDSADVDLWQEQTQSGGWYLTGQALSLAGGEMDPPLAATLVSEDVTSQVASIENAEFSFESVSAGRYSLSLLWNDLEIQVDDLSVGCAEAP
jgi:hypothetical protein